MRAAWPSPVARIGVRRLLDAVLVLLIVATFAAWTDPDLLLDALWVVLAVGAFVFGFRLTMLRMLIVMGAELTYLGVTAITHGRVLELEIFELTEWPLVIIISVIVALMADRISGIARRYALMYRDASERLVTAHEDVRTRLARDIHDGVGQTLSAALLTLDAANASLVRPRRSGGAPPDLRAARASLGKARSLVSAALDEAHDVAAQLRPLRVNEIGLGAAIKDLASAAGTPIDTRFAARRLPPGLLEPERQIDTFRIVQEALANATSHSRAMHIWIKASVNDEAVKIEIGDDGVGFNRPPGPEGLGLMNMEERATILGARLDIQSITGIGTTVRLIVPRRKPAEDEAYEAAPTTVMAQGAVAQGSEATV